MTLEHIIAAVDNSQTSREAARTAARLAAQSGAELTVVAVAPGPRPGKPGSGAVTPLDLVEEALGCEFFADFPGLAVEIAGIHGLPQVEIGRFAEHRKADLIVLGRKPRSRATRVFLGDTADAVVRRSRIPCLLVPPGLTTLSRMLVALDGTDRGFIVYDRAADVAAAGGMQLSAVTVEPAWPGEPAALAGTLPSARSERLSSMIEGKSRKSPRSTATLNPQALQVRHGDIVDEIVAAVTESRADVLVLGFHRGGPALVVDGGSISRRLIHAVPCAVLTMPF